MTSALLSFPSQTLNMLISPHSTTSIPSAEALIDPRKTVTHASLSLTLQILHVLGVQRRDNPR
jgi:hypothetical protein